MSYKDIDFKNESIGVVTHGNKELREVFIIRGFETTENLIYERIKDNGEQVYEDDLIYPYLHTVRHTYELCLKSIISNMYKFYEDYKKNYINFDTRKYEQVKFSHNLGKLYSFIKNNFYNLDSRCIEYKSNIKFLYQSIYDFLPEEDNDPYRYAENKKNQENLNDLNQVSFDKAHESVKEFIKRFKSIDSFLNLLNGEYKLGTFYKNFSRNQILKIAKELPSYDKWSDESFIKTKQYFMDRYRLSSTDFSKIANIIKDSRWLSYFIKFKRKDYSEIFETLKECIKSNQEILSKINKLDKNLSKDKLNKIQKIEKEKQDFTNKLKYDDIILITTYYHIGRSLELRAENFNDQLQYWNDFYGKAISKENLHYFTQKLYNNGFISNLLNGIYQSGDYELVSLLIEYLENDLKYSDISEFKNGFDLIYG